jgi:hypothetical protein
MILEPERAAVLLAERLSRPSSGQAGSPRAPLTTVGATSGKEWLVQRTLEELGIHCEANGALQDLKGFLIATPRGAEIVISDRLTPEERLAVYAHLLAHALLEEDGAKSQAFFSRLEYVEGREPSRPSSAERRADRVASALAQAILQGRLDVMPQYSYRRKREPARNSGLRPALGRFFLEMSHRTSLALFWYLPQYRKLRSRREIALLIRHVENLTRVAYAC